MNQNTLLNRYREIRKESENLAAPLSIEETRIQSMPDVSPPWWNLGHTSWFFAANILKPYDLSVPEDEHYHYLLNSYYNSLGNMLPRPDRGKISTPSTEMIYAYRHSVDERMEALLKRESTDEQIRNLVTVGLNHEQQHQELMVTEIKHIRWQNPFDLRPILEGKTIPEVAGPELKFHSVPGGDTTIGQDEKEWCYDNETPRHRRFIQPFQAANRLITNREYLAFMEDGGYSNSLLWLSDGWEAVKKHRWTAPLYWEWRADRWWLWTLYGNRPVPGDAPVTHISFYEAQAFATWYGARLLTEFEWETVALYREAHQENGQFLENRIYEPGFQTGQEGWLGTAWEWTTSHFEPYPGFKPFPGALTEYNAKFMNNVRVLRGGSCATPRSHIRRTYRNFWSPETRFQFTGIRLGQDA